jgi:hypothetical protein
MIQIERWRGGLAAALSLFLPTEMAAGQTYDPMRPLQAMPQPDAAGSAAAVQVQPNPEFENLPDTPGVEETYYGCTACHSTAIIKQQRLSDARWDYLWDWMIKEQGMAETDEKTKATILAYVKTHFSSQR